VDEKSDRLEKIVKRATIVLVAVTLVLSFVIAFYVQVIR
jgi:uncharacterized protein YqhQ